MTSQTEPGGVRTAVALLLVAGALVVGAASGLAIGVAAGYLVGSHMAGDRALSEPGALALAVAPDGNRAAAPDADTPADPPAGDPESGDAGSEGLLPGVPALPGITLDGVPRPFLGVEVATAAGAAAGSAAEDGDAGDEASAAGARISSIVPGSAAEEAGLLAGDLIVSVDGNPIGDGEALAAAIARADIGDELQLAVRRGDEELTLTATLGERPDVIQVEPGMQGLEDLLDQMPPEIRERYRELLQPPSPDSEA